MAKIANQDRDLVFLDSETTGLNPLHNEAIEWAAIRTKRDGVTLVERYEAKVQPTYPERFDDYAKQVNGYNEAEWADAPDPAKVAWNLQRICAGVILVGQNVSFDENFLTQFLAKFNMKPTWHYHKIDTMNLAWPLIKEGSITGLSLVQIAEWAGIKQVEPHRAMSDAECVQHVYGKLMSVLSRGVRTHNVVAEVVKTTAPLV